MQNQTIIKLSIPYKIFLFLMCFGLAFLCYTQLHGQSVLGAFSRGGLSGKFAFAMILFSIMLVLMFISFFFDLRKIVVDHNGISSFELGNNRKAHWGDIINVAKTSKGVRITTRSEVFYIGYGMRATDRILKAVSLHSSGGNSRPRQAAKSAGRIF